MLRRFVLPIFVIGMVMLAAFLAYAYTTKSFMFTPKIVHLHAGFQVYINGKLQDYSSFRYMDITPCTQRGLATEDPQEVKAHLHENVGDVVHVHRDGVIWKDLFINIHNQTVLNGPTEGYINGKKVDNILDYPIKAYDIAIFFVGKHDDIKTYLPHAVSIWHIKAIERKSELCGAAVH